MNKDKSTQLRTLTLKHLSIEVTILIPINIWTQAEQVKEDYLKFDNNFINEEFSTLDLISLYLDQSLNQSDDQSYPLANVIFDHLQTYYLKGNNIHSVVAKLSSMNYLYVIKTYYKASEILNYKPEFTGSALFKQVEAKEAALLCVFSGQGTFDSYFEELNEVYSTYNGMVTPFIKQMTKVISDFSKEEFNQSIHTIDFDILNWLSSPEKRPDLEYLISPSISLPLVGLIQLSHYYVSLKALNFKPFEMSHHFTGTTGHSQGIISSTVISTSKTMEEFYLNSEKALKLLCLIGARAQQTSPQITLAPNILKDSIDNGEGKPSSMLSIFNLNYDQVQMYVDNINSHLNPERQIYINLINGPRSIVCSGHPESLYGLNLTLRKNKVQHGTDQTRIPHSQRKINITNWFLSIAAPFHTPYLDPVLDLLEEDIRNYKLEFQASDLNIPVYSTFSGENLYYSSDLTMDLIRQICTLPVNWELATNKEKNVTHILDFGPGGSSGIGGLTFRNKEGMGIQIIIAGSMRGPNKSLSYKSELFDLDKSKIRYSVNWAKQFGPKLIKLKYNEKVILDTRFSRLIGKPPIMVAGMTPCTVSDRFVSATINAGYHVELAGGGHFSEQMLIEKIRLIMQKTRPGEGITLNILFLNSFQWSFQFPLILKLRKEGYPINGICIAAGVPSLELANTIVTELKEAGINHVSFKPGSSTAIKLVISIAEKNPDFHVILQWTGGRAGGHHSFEDFHQPILETYCLIRKRENLFLIAGSGFGAIEDTYPYFTGSWSKKFQFPPMPFDGVLFGSRMLVSLESESSLPTKEAIVNAKGVEDKDWELTYKKETGGVLTVKSELGEPIHKIATRGVQLWKELDDTIFSLSKEKRLKAIEDKRDYIIDRLNKDSQKVWFSKKQNGDNVDLADMNYADIIVRMIELMFIKHENKWLDATLRDFVGNFINRTEERLSDHEHDYILQEFIQLNEPYKFIEEFFQSYPACNEQLLTSEDVNYFLSYCLRRDIKPVPFIPLLDLNFEYWFKKDSLWQSENLSAVYDQDVQRTCILQGPVAVKYSTVANQPVKNILDEINDGLIAKLKKESYLNANIPSVEYMSNKKIAYNEHLANIIVNNSAFETIITTTNDRKKQLPQRKEWLELISGPNQSWLKALLTSDIIIQNHNYVHNGLKKVFRPRYSQKIIIQYKKDSVVSISVYDAQEKLAIQCSYENDLIIMNIYENKNDKSIPLILKFLYVPQNGDNLIHEVMQDKNERIKHFYYQLWFETDGFDALNHTKKTSFQSKGFQLKRIEIEKFCQSVGNQNELYIDRGQKIMVAPLDYAIVVGWDAIIKSIFPDFIDGDLLKLVHLSNSFKMLEGGPLMSDDAIDTYAEITSLTNTDSGKKVEVTAVLKRLEVPVIEVKSQFLYRGQFFDYENTFTKSREILYSLELQNKKDIALLKSKSWIHWNEDAPKLRSGNILIFNLDSYSRFKSSNVYSLLEVKGTVSLQISIKEFVTIANIDYTTSESYGNPIIEFLKRIGKSIEPIVHFENGGYPLLTEDDTMTLRSPLSNHSYSKSSHDFNPIHTNVYLSNLAELPGTITHGMWTSASTRKFVERFAAENNPLKVSNYQVDFVAMVLPNDQLNTKLYHIGMQNGKKVIKIETYNQDQTLVLKGTAEVDQPLTAYVFTGQGSQEVGMGMKLYDSSLVAKEIWDKADKHVINNYGFSILSIVKNNPKELTVYFGGGSGKHIRNNYLSLTYELYASNGETQTLPLFPTITNKSISYTYTSIEGLLYSTQFTQPALTLMEMAAFEDMRNKGLVSPNSPFAGHSLGEYSALCSIANVLTVEALIDLVFYRGLTMQFAVKRDKLGRSAYGMIAVNPSRVNDKFTQIHLQYIVEAISSISNNLLEIVNFNIENYQYVISGHLINLDCLANTLNYIKVAKIDFVDLFQANNEEFIKENVAKIISKNLEKSNSKHEKEHIVLQRGYATIPLAGIDVPFHSSFLMSGVQAFRTFILKNLNAKDIDLNILKNRYIPNLIAKPFDISKEYIEEIVLRTKSPYLIKLLESWDPTSFNSYHSKQHLAYVILIELLAYQFASPVRWIETQDQLFQTFNVERLIEIGPSATLANIALQTLKFKYEEHDDAVINKRSILSYYKNEQDIYYLFDPIKEPTPKDKPAEIFTPKQVQATQVQRRSNAPSSFSDEPIRALDVLHIIIAQKIKRKLNEIVTTKSIKDLSGGKSALQNELLGDLSVEFGELPDKSEDLTLVELGDNLQRSYQGKLGKYTSNLITKLIGSKLPASFNMSFIKDYLNINFGLGALRMDAVLLHALVEEPQQRLSSDSEAKLWLENIVQSYTNKVGINLNPCEENQGESVGGQQISSEEFIQWKKKQDVFFKRQIELYAHYIGFDLTEYHHLLQIEKGINQDLQSRIDIIELEHDDVYIQGIKPSFDVNKVRFYDSYWNWSKQDAILLYFDIVFGKLKSIDREITRQCIHIMNRSDQSLIDYMKYKINTIELDQGQNYQLAKEYAELLFTNSIEMLPLDPVYKDVSFPTSPKTIITEKGDIVYSEVPREGIRKLADYVNEMKVGSKLTRYGNKQKVQQNLDRMATIVHHQVGIKKEYKNELLSLYDDIVRSFSLNSISKKRVRNNTARKSKSEKMPFIHIKKKEKINGWIMDKNESLMYLDLLLNIAEDGLTLIGKTVLLTGCGSDSIGSEILKGLLSGGAKVIVTTSRFQTSTAEYYQNLYQRYGTKGSKLVLVPFNQASQKDVDNLIEYIYQKDLKKGLGLDLDFVFPFAAIAEANREITNIDGRSELAHRIMLTNVIRIIGKIKTMKEKLSCQTRPAQIILPLSPNHGTFGGDGLYSESKLSLENLLNRWTTESWSQYITIVGAVIGWTRGTGLMQQNNILAEEVEKLGVRTFSTQEMAFNLLGLMHPYLTDLAEKSPVWVDLNGGFQFLPKFHYVVAKIRKSINDTAMIRKAISLDTSKDHVMYGHQSKANKKCVPRANIKFQFPSLKAYDEVRSKLAYMDGMLNLDKIIVVTGFSEVGPYGNSRTRWEMEAYGEFSLEGCIELAWIMGYIKQHNDKLKDCGWADAGTGEPVMDCDVKKLYEKRILEHSGIRIVEPASSSGYDPDKRKMLREVVLDHDLEPIEVSKSESLQFQHQHGDKVDLIIEGDQVLVRFKKGAALYLPKALRHDRIVAGQIPQGWDAARYGLPQDIIDQVDPATLYGLVCTVEALVTSGITDPYELYNFIHVSEIGNCIGSGLGGVLSQQKMYNGRMREHDIQSDILQETFINTMPAWINLLILSASGPIKTPVGACATALQSIEIGVDTILSGKAKMCLVGGYDDLGEEGVVEFANMKATANSRLEMDHFGRSACEISRPASSSRSGFVESHGAGVHILMSASLALELGAPIYGIIALTNTAMDKEGRSVPAPGQGILTTAKEIPSVFKSRLLDIHYRKAQLDKAKLFIKQQVEDNYKEINHEIEMLQDGQIQSKEQEQIYYNERLNQIKIEANHQLSLLSQHWGSEFYKNNSAISPLRGALSVYGLNIDDIGMASFHGTSTKANDYNESSVLNQQFQHLQRTRGNICYSVFQKSLTGHPKGAAASWMLNGVLQSLQSGLVPGNRNLDNVDSQLQQFDYLLYPSRSIQTDGIKAALLKSFGFGQVGGEVLVVHPNYLFASLSKQCYSHYVEKNKKRYQSSYRYFHQSISGISSLINVKNESPYNDLIQSAVYLNPDARSTYDVQTKSYKHTSQGLINKKDLIEEELEISKLMQSNGKGIGVDLELISSFSIDNSTFIERNFTNKEIDYCFNQPHFQSSFTGKWAAKESIIKALSSLNPKRSNEWNLGSGAPLKDIEILNLESGLPQVHLAGYAKSVAQDLGVKDLKVSISHSGDYAIAVSMASF